MPTINEIQANLLDYSSEGRFWALNQTINAIAPSQVHLISPSVLSQTLYNLFNFDQSGSFDSVANSVRIFMGKLGQSTDYIALSNAMLVFSDQGNFKALDAVTDLLTLPQQAEIGLTRAVGDTLLNIVSHDNPTIQTDDSAIAAVIRDLMAKMGQHADYVSIGDAMLILSNSGNFKALDAVTDYLTLPQQAEIGLTRAVGDTLLNIVSHDNPTIQTDDSAIAAVIRDLMIKIGQHADYVSIGDAMLILSNNGNFKALDAVTDYLTVPQKAEIGLTRAVGDTLLNIVSYDNPTIQTDDSAIAAVIRDLMNKLGVHADYTSIADAMLILSNNGNFTALDAATDFLTDPQKAEIGLTNAVGDTLLNIISYDNPTTQVDDSAIAGVIRNLMVKLGVHADATSIDDAIVRLSANGNDVGLGAIFDHLSSVQYQAVSDAIKSETGATFGNYGNNTITGTGAHDKVFAMGGNDTVRGGNGHDELFGNSGSDLLYGENGNDILIGGIGADTLSGGAGADTFVFDNRAGIDKITDFSKAQGDKIDLSAVLDGFEPGADAITDFIFARNNGKDTILSVDVNGTAAGGLSDLVIVQNVNNMDVLDLVNKGTIII